MAVSTAKLPASATAPRSSKNSTASSAPQPADARLTVRENSGRLRRLAILWGGYLVNNETRKGRPARIALGDPMPTEIEILPSPDRLADCCTVAALQEGIEAPSPLSIAMPNSLRSRYDRGRDQPPCRNSSLGW